jgi:poly(3-hydroxybutyrate) depolymerase
VLVNDIEFTLDIISSLQSTYCISSKKIFAAGKSNGGGLVSLLACDQKATSIIAAFAPVSGAYYFTKEGKPPSCNPSRSPIPVLEFHGYQDETIPYLGGNNTRNNGIIPSILEWINDWATRDGCLPVQNRTTTLCGTGKKEVRKYEWNCKGVDGVVQHYNISNLKHQWPSTTGNDDGDRTTCFEASELIMQFFGRHSLP